jgi:hypothetical protein
MILAKSGHGVPILVSLVKVAAVWNLKFYLEPLNILLAQTMPTSKNVGKENTLLSSKHNFVQSGFRLDH